MKKCIGLATLVFIGSIQAYAYPAWNSTECNEAKGGSIITRGTQTFCQSNSTMNWWSVYAWCQAMGGHLPTIMELCPSMPAIVSRADCGLTYPGNGAWSSTPVAAGSNSMWYLGFGNTLYEGARTKYNPVFCLK